MRYKKYLPVERSKPKAIRHALTKQLEISRSNLGQIDWSYKYTSTACVHGKRSWPFRLLALGYVSPDVYHLWSSGSLFGRSPLIGQRWHALDRTQLFEGLLSKPLYHIVQQIVDVSLHTNLCRHGQCNPAEQTRENSAVNAA